MDRKITNEEKVEFIKKVLNANYLSEIEQAFLEIKNSSNTINEGEALIQKKEISNGIDVASIYSKNALPFVREDLKNHPTADTKQVVNDFAPETEETKEGPVLKKALVPNPWGESGAKLVSPGEKLDY